MRFYLIDKINVMVLGNRIEGIKCVTKSEDFFEQHFPGYPVMPGVLIIESMAQLSGYLLSKTKEAKGQYIFAILSMVEKAKFYKMVSPGEQMKIISEIEKDNDESAMVKTQAFIEGERVSEAKMMFIFFPIEGETESAKRNILSDMFAGIEDKANPFIAGNPNMSRERHVVITGIGIVSPVGIGWEKYWQNIKAGSSCVKELTPDMGEYLPLRYGSILEDIDCKAYFGNLKLLKNLNRANQFALLAAHLALTDSNIHPEIPPERKSLFFLTGMGQVDVLDLESSIEYSKRDGHFSYDLMGDKGIKLINPLLPVKALPNIGLGVISILFGFKGMNIVASPFESETAMLLDDAVQTIKNNEADLCLVGGTDAPFCVSIMSNLVTMEKHWREKEQQLPMAEDFSLQLAEGSVFIVLEEAEQAIAAGKRIYGYIGQCSTTSLSKIPWDYDELRTAYEYTVNRFREKKQTGFVILADNGIDMVKRVEKDYWSEVGWDTTRLVSFKKNSGFMITSAQLLDICHACFMISDISTPAADSKDNIVQSVLVCGVSLSQGVSTVLISNAPES